MINKDELLERIEDTLTTRQVKELFKTIVEECEDDGIHSVDYVNVWELINELEKSYAFHEKRLSSVAEQSEYDKLYGKLSGLSEAIRVAERMA